MLIHLQVRDLAIVDRVELEFNPGLTALTGETGAGKSIIVDALLLAAGGRAGPDAVRQGAERAEVSACFSVPGGPAAQWLADQSIDHQGEIILRRVIGADGRSRAYLNGQLVPLQTLRDFSDHVMEIHGQQEFQHLVKRSEQRNLLDAFGVEPALGQAVTASHVALRSCRERFDALKSASDERESRLGYLEFQIAELRNEAGSIADIGELFADLKRFANRGRLAAAARCALDLTDASDSGNAHDLLARGAAAIRTAAESDPHLAAAAELLREAQVSAREAAAELSRYLDALDADPAQIEELERRAAALEALARKHRVPATGLPAVLIQCEQEHAALASADATLAGLAQELARLETTYTEAALALSLARSKAALDLGAQVSRLMQGLGMASGRFEVKIHSDPQSHSPHGIDEVEFLVSPNPGQPLKALARVASGGELSRISLAIQVAAAQQGCAACMVFDEVDAGVGGAVAEIIGRRLRELAERSQVLCVTHLPQVAAQAHNQFRVVKLSAGQNTRTAVHALKDSERVEEIARMLGGVSITDTAREHAREMLTSVAPLPGAASARRTRGRRST